MPDPVPRQLVVAGVKCAELLSVTLWSPTLLAADLHCGLLSLRRSPYRTGDFKQHLLARQVHSATEAFTFGETPWFTVRRMLQRTQLRPGERLVDLGSGVGRVVLYAALRFGARAMGVEAVAERHAMAEQILRRRATEGVELRLGNIADVDLKEADVVYCAWTCFPAASREQVLQTLVSLRPGARIITATHPAESDRIEHLAEEPAWFSWGRGTLHYHYVR